MEREMITQTQKEKTIETGIVKHIVSGKFVTAELKGLEQIAKLTNGKVYLTNNIARGDPRLEIRINNKKCYLSYLSSEGEELKDVLVEKIIKKIETKAIQQSSKNIVISCEELEEIIIDSMKSLEIKKIEKRKKRVQDYITNILSYYENYLNDEQKATLQQLLKNLQQPQQLSIEEIEKIEKMVRENVGNVIELVINLKAKEEKIKKLEKEIEKLIKENEILESLLKKIDKEKIKELADKIEQGKIEEEFSKEEKEKIEELASEIEFEEEEEEFEEDDEEDY